MYPLFEDWQLQTAYNLYKGTAHVSLQEKFGGPCIGTAVDYLRSIFPGTGYAELAGYVEEVIKQNEPNYGTPPAEWIMELAYEVYKGDASKDIHDQFGKSGIVAAVKYLRDRTGCSLRDAKHWIDAEVARQEKLDISVVAANLEKRIVALEKRTVVLEAIEASKPVKLKLPDIERTTSVPAHSPGPWSTYGDQLGNPRIVDKRSFCIVHRTAPTNIPGIHGYSRAETQANARLIAAAPELLEALMAMLASNATNWHKLKGNAMRVIAKAQGKD